VVFFVFDVGVGIEGEIKVYVNATVRTYTYEAIQLCYVVV